MLLLFLLFPRLGPLWSLPLPGGQATTGLSDSMMPGDFVELSQSTELAFRVKFDDAAPPQDQLYWRALTWRISTASAGRSPGRGAANERRTGAGRGHR